ncbi:MAG: hypothetical protein QOG89_3440, partial [Thermomicrobiales bacterium]|nr:hypothetical protein [Thermomicrobiales bacterium]
VLNGRVAKTVFDAWVPAGAISPGR